MTNTTKKQIVIGALILLALAGVLFVFLTKQASGGSQKITVKKGPIIEAIYGIGTVTSNHSFHFKVGQVKTVQKLFITEGDNVKKGQLLVELADGIRVLSPFDGTVTSLPFTEGENVFQDAPILVVEDLRDRYVLVSLEQQGALRVKKGLQVKLNFESFRDKNFSGVVKSIYPQKGQFTVRVEVQDLPLEILPGMTADSSILVAEKDLVLLIPVLAVNNGKVLVERNGKQEKVAVKMGTMDNEWVEIVDDSLHEGDTVIMKK
jgi:multidrug efflux pump subunit AcrA (membrane-fusion protein)